MVAIPSDAAGVWIAGNSRMRARHNRDALLLDALADHPNLAVDGRFEEALTAADTLAAWVAVDGRLPLGDVLAVGVKLAGALETAHELGVVHGAVSPEAIVVSPAGEAQLGWTGRPGPRTSHRAIAADVAGLGASLILLATGEPLSGVAHRVGPRLREQGLPDALIDVLLQCVTPQGNAQRMTARAVGVALQQVEHAAGLPVTELVVGPRPRRVPGGAPTPTGAEPAPARAGVARTDPGVMRAERLRRSTRRTRVRIGLGLAVAAALALTPGQAGAATSALQLGSRIVPDGASNPAISVAVSQAGFSPDSTRVALLARDDLWVDALASGGLQGVLDAPLLLSTTQSVSPEALDELERLGVSSVYVLGGPEAMAPRIDEQLREAGFEVERVAGADRVETAVEAARRFFPDADNAVLLPGYDGPGQDSTRGYVDGLGAGALAARKRYPVLLTDPSALSVGTREYLRGSAVRTIWIPGGIVSDSVVSELDRLGLEVQSPITVGRIAGSDRFDTAALMAGASGPYDTVLLLEGNSMRVFSAGYAVAGLAARANAAVVLVDGPSMPPQTAQFLSSHDASVVCGPAVDEAVCEIAGTLPRSGAGS